MAAERLQKILAAAGLASRRKAEELITAGQVSVNGHTVTELGTKADPRTDEIRVNGKLVGGRERHVYFVLYKPKGVMTTVSDPEGRPTVMDSLKTIKERVFPVGRLDYMSEGLLLLTNDGDLMAELTHAGSHVPKTYQVKVSGQPTAEDIQKLRDGVWLPPEPGMTGVRGKKQPGVERRSFGVKTQPAHIDLVRTQDNPWYEVTLTEGRNRQIRRMFEQIGFHVEKIKRVRYGTLTLDVEPGQWRQLNFREVSELRKSIGKPFRVAPPRKRLPLAGPPRERTDAPRSKRPATTDRTATPRREPRDLREAPTRYPRESSGDRERPFRGGPRSDRPKPSGPPRGDRDRAPRREFSSSDRERPFRGGPSSDRPKPSGPPRGDRDRAPRREFSSGDRERPFRGGPRSDRPKPSGPPRGDRDRAPRREFSSSDRERPFRGGPRSDRPKPSGPPRGDRDRAPRREFSSDRERPFRGGPSSDRPKPSGPPRGDRERAPRREFSSDRERPFRGGPRSDRPKPSGPPRGDRDRAPRREFSSSDRERPFRGGPRSDRPKPSGPPRGDRRDVRGSASRPRRDDRPPSRRRD